MNMNMNEAGSIALGLGGGLLLGLVFFGGLWWTVRKGLSSNGAAFWFAGSYLARMAILAGGLWFMVHDNALRGAAAAIGLVLVRVALVRLGGGRKAGVVCSEGGS